MERHDTIAACLQGDEQAWESLVDRLWPVVAGTVWKCCGGTRDANAIDDICQDVFVKLCVDDFRALRRFDPARGSLERYAAVMARSTAVDAIRGKSKARHIAISSFMEESLPAPEGDRPLIEDWEFAAALGTLTEREREVMERLYRREMSTGDAAAELGMAEATVRVHKMSGLEKMRKFFGIA